MSCDAERVSGYVDEVLDDAVRAAVEEHLASCPACRGQAGFEREIRGRLHELPAIEPPRGLEDRVRRRLRPSAAPRRLAWLLPLAAGLAGLALWVRGSASLVAWELARDHAHCFGFERLPAEVWSGDPEQIAAWFELHGARIPLVPASAAGLALVGGRFCPLPDGSRVAHLYYVGENRHLSLFVLAHGVKLGGAYSRAVRGESVHLTRVGDATVGLVSGRQEDVEAFRRVVTTTLARFFVLRPGPLTARRPPATIGVRPVGL